MKRATKAEKLGARTLYEQEGMTYSDIARELDFAAPTVRSWAKKEGWVHPDDQETSPEPDTSPYAEGSPDREDPWGDGIDTSAPGWERSIYTGPDNLNPPTSDAELQKQVEALMAENATLQEEVDKYKPTVDISQYLTDPITYIEENTPEGPNYWKNRAEADFARENRQRHRQGLPTLSLKDEPEILEGLIDDIKAHLKGQWDKEPTTEPARTVKLFIMRNGYPTIEQLPYEAQVNNIAGSLADGIVRYTRKGFKLTDPFLCPRRGCFRAAATDEFGRWSFDTYCSERHRQEVEGDNESPMGVDAMPTVLSGVR